MRIFTDQMGRQLVLGRPAKRIVSLVPSQTELLFALGLRQAVVGVTKFCVHPARQARRKTIVGGTKKFRFDTIDALCPDLIIGNKEENYAEGIARLSQRYPVWMSDIETLADAYGMIAAIGGMTGTEAHAYRLVWDIKRAFRALPRVAGSQPRVVYLIWWAPIMAVGHATFIDHLLLVKGWHNAVALPRYPTYTIAGLKALNPDLVLLSSEPFPFKASHAQAIAAALPQAEIMFVDGEMFSWYGSRLLKTARYLATMPLSQPTPAKIPAMGKDS